MFLRNIFESLTRTGEGKAAVIGWGRGMGHKGHMFLASSVITHAGELGADPYFVVSRTVGKDDPITPEEKLAIYKKVFPKSGHIFQTATEEMPDLTRVLTKLQGMGYSDVTVVVGADQVNALGYVKNYNGKPDKSGNIPFSFNSLNVISRQETNDPSRDQEGPRATPMRAVLMDPNKSEEEKFAVWRDAMNPELSDEEVMDLMHKAEQRMKAMVKPKKGVAEGLLNEFAPGSGDDDDKYTPPNFGKPYKSRYLNNNQFDIWCETDTPGKDIQLKVTVDKYGLEFDGRYWFIDSPGGVHLRWKYGEIPLPGAIDQARNPGHIHDLISDFINKKRAGDLQNVAKFYGFTDDGKVAKLRAAGDKRREEQLKSRNIAKKNESIAEAPIEMDPADPMNPRIYGHQGANSSELKTRMMRARRQLQDLAQRAENGTPLDWEMIGKHWPELSMNIEQIKHAIEELAKVRRQGGIRSRGIDPNIGEEMMPASSFAGSKKNKLGPAGHLKATDDHARAGDLVGSAEESIRENWEQARANAFVKLLEKNLK